MSTDFIFEEKGRYKILGERKFSKLGIIYLSNSSINFWGHMDELVIPLNTIKNLKLCKSGFWQNLFGVQPRKVSIQTNTGETYLILSEYNQRLYKQLSKALSNGNDVQIGKEFGVAWIIFIIIVILIGLFYVFTRLIGSI